MTEQSRVTSIGIQRAIIHRERLSENATVTFEIANLQENGKVFPVHSTVPARD